MNGMNCKLIPVCHFYMLRVHKCQCESCVTWCLAHGASDRLHSSPLVQSLPVRSILQTFATVRTRGINHQRHTGLHPLSQRICAVPAIASVTLLGPVSMRICHMHAIANSLPCSCLPAFASATLLGPVSK